MLVNPLRSTPISQHIHPDKPKRFDGRSSAFVTDGLRLPTVAAATFQASSKTFRRDCSADGLPIEPHNNSLCPIDAVHVTCSWGALIRAVPKFGRRVNDIDCGQWLRYKEIPSVQFGRLLAKCRRLCAHAKTVGEVEVRCTWSQLSPGNHGSSLPAPHPTVFSLHFSKLSCHAAFCARER